MRHLPTVALLIFLVATVIYVVKEKNFTAVPEEYITLGSGSTVAEPTTTINTNVRSVLDMSSRGLRKAPAFIFDMTDIEELNLSDNVLDGALQTEVRRLQNLKILDLSDNKFTGVPAEIGQLRNLEILDLSNNLLTGLPLEMGNLTKLKLLDISGNSYSEADLSNIRGMLPTSTIIKTN